MNFLTTSPRSGVLCPEDNHPPTTQLNSQSDRPPTFVIPVAADSIPVTELSAMCSRVYEHVCRRAAKSSKCYESQAKMAECLGCSKSTIQRSLDELCDKRLLSCQIRSGETSIYTLTDPSEWKVKLNEPHLAQPRQTAIPPSASLLPHPSQPCYPTPSSRATQRNKSKKQLKETTTNKDVVVSFEKKDPESELTGKQINTPVEQHESGMDETDNSLDSERDHLFRRAENLISENLTPSLKQEIKKHSFARVEAALEALEEGLEAGKVHNPPGFLVRALKGGWTPSAKGQGEIETRGLKEFKEWFPHARSAGIVAGSQRQGDEIVCYTRDDKWIPWRELIAEHPAEALKQVVEDKQRAEAALPSATGELSLREPTFT